MGESVGREGGTVVPPAGTGVRNDKLLVGWVSEQGDMQGDVALVYSPAKPVVRKG